MAHRVTQMQSSLASRSIRTPVGKTAATRSSLQYCGHVLTQQVADILHGKLAEEPHRRGIYIVRDGDIVLYVGKTERGVSRSVLKHCGIGADGAPPDQLGQLIIENAPESGNWQVEFLSPKNCAPYVGRSFMKIDIHNAERAIINHFRPCLSDTKDTNLPGLPERYRR